MPKLAVLLLTVFALIGSACSQPPEPQPVAKTGPSVQATSPSQAIPLAQANPQTLSAPHSWIDAPLHGSTVMLAPVQVVSHSTHPAGVSQVELSVNGAVVASEESPEAKQSLLTMRQTWKPVAAGKYTLNLRAKSPAGVWGQNASAEVTVKAFEAARASGPPPLAAAGSSATPTPTAVTVAAVTPSTAPRVTAPPVQEPTDTPRPVVTDTPLPVPSDTPVPPRVPTETAVPIVVPTDTPVPARVPTDTPVPALPPTFTPTATNPPLLIITLVPRPPILPTATPTPLPKPGFGSPSVNPSRFYWGDSGCGPKEVAVSVSASNASSVKIFYSVSGQRWASADMASVRGAWTKTINSADVPGYNTSATAQFQFYFVGTNDAGQTQSPTYWQHGDAIPMHHGEVVHRSHARR